MNLQSKGSDSLQRTFSLILERYGHARQNLSFAGHHEIRELFETAKRLLESNPAVRDRPHLKVVASYGKGNWATIPWISLLDDRETTTTQDGTYAVYLFREDGAGVYMKLAQGVTKAEQQLGAQAIPVLAQRAKQIRAQVQGLYAHGFDLSGKSDLGTNHRMARLYEASTIAAKYYPSTEIPDDGVMFRDLELMLDAYETFVSTAGARKQSERKVALVGTWKTVRNDYPRVRRLIEAQGAWASPWSFGLKDGAQTLLQPPFYLYVNGGGGQIVARARVDDMVTARGMDGLISPWPEVTQSEWVGVKKFGERQSEVNKTWLKLGSLELVRPFRALELDLVPQLSTPENLLNQNSFGYAFEQEDLVAQEYERNEIEDVPVDMDSEVPLDLAWLQQETLLDEKLLKGMVDALLTTSPQVLLAGPPGTSKTWVAKKLAEYVVRGRNDAVRTVQFHPSYTYESFIEGLRPVSRQSGVSFELMPGAVLETVNEMRRRGHIDRMDRPYVMILDEANRANLPRVLGELLFLFEYRNEKVKLQYSGDFSLPRNLYFIGTMNTADRSIRAIDSALRRRFDVFELGADSDVLERYLQKNGHVGGAIADGLATLNEVLTTQLDRHHTVGHAFFMRKELDAQAVRNIWDRRIYPLIEEYFFDQPDLAKEFSFARFWPSYES